MGNLYSICNFTSVTNNSGTTTFTDTTGSAVLTVSGSSNIPPVAYTYTAPNGTAVSVKQNYTAYTVRTNFGVTGITEYGPTTVNLVSSITLPDGSSYGFTYETTPGYPNDVTGRIAKVTLPTGGSISYAYNAGTNGKTILSDGSAGGITRTVTPGGNQPTGVWTYARTGSTNNFDTVTNPDGTVTVHIFSGTYQTEALVYPPNQGPIETFVNCYNGVWPSGSSGNWNFSPCINQTVTTPITIVANYRIQPNNMYSVTVNHYDSTYGRLTETDDYDWSLTTAPLIRKKLITYATLTNGIVDRPSSVVIQVTFPLIPHTSEYES